MASIRELLQHFKDDAKLQPLFVQMEELEKRVEAANAQNVTDPRTRGKGQRPGRPGSRSWRSDAEQQQASDDGQGEGNTNSKVEDAVLPVPPADPYGALPTPQGGYDWEALQHPVNQACAQFASPGAKATWKKWALTSNNVRVVVGVAWWVVAHVFRPDHPLSAAIKEHVFRLFSKQYALDVLTYGGAGKELYHNLWHSVMSAAAVELLRGAFPRSTHKLDKHLVAFVQNQLVRWTTGPLPADLHPSHHELVGNSPPAAVTHVARHHHAASLSGSGPNSTPTQHTSHQFHHQHLLMSKSHPHQHTGHHDNEEQPASCETTQQVAAKTTSTTRSPFLNAYSSNGLSVSGCDGHRPVVANVVSGAALSPSIARITATGANPGSKSDTAGMTRTTADADGSRVLQPTRSIMKQLSMSPGGFMQHPGSDSSPTADDVSSSLCSPVPPDQSPDAAGLLKAGSRSRRVMMLSPFADNSQQMGSLVEEEEVQSREGCGQGMNQSDLQGPGQQQSVVGRPSVSPPTAGKRSPPTALVIPQDEPPRQSLFQAANGTDNATSTFAAQHTSPTDVSDDGATATATGTLLPPTGFQLLQHSPTVSHLFEAHSLGMPRQAEGAVPGLMSQTFGTGQRSRRRPLDAHAPVPKPPHDSTGAGDAQQPGNQVLEQQPEFSYKALAKQSCQRAADAVARYEACKAAARKDVARLRKDWLSNRDGLQAKVNELAMGNAAKDMSDRLSNWIENDVDRMLRDQPPATVHVAPAKGSELTPRQGPKPMQASERGKLRTSSSAPQSATEAVLAVRGGASAGASLLAGGGAPSSVDRSGRPPGYLAMTSAAVAGAGRASASFLAMTTSTASNSGPSTTRIMQPWSRMRSIETQIRSTLSQARYGSNDIASKLAVQEKVRQEQENVPGLVGNMQRGAAWRPAPVEYARGALDFRLKQHVQQAMQGLDLEIYK